MAIMATYYLVDSVMKRVIATPPAGFKLPSCQPVFGLSFGNRCHAPLPLHAPSSPPHPLFPSPLTVSKSVGCASLLQPSGSFFTRTPVITSTIGVLPPPAVPPTVGPTLPTLALRPPSTPADDLAPTADPDSPAAVAWLPDSGWWWLVPPPPPPQGDPRPAKPITAATPLMPPPAQPLAGRVEGVGGCSQMVGTSHTASTGL